MALQRISASAAAADLSAFSTIIDARSPAEFALDHLPGAVNWPTLNDEERHLVGSEYKQVAAFEADIDIAVTRNFHGGDAWN